MISEKFSTPRWSTFVSLLASKTRFSQKDVQIVEDERKDCAVVIHQEQLVIAKRNRIDGKGKSGAQLAADEAELELLAENERKRLQDTLPERAEQWLSKASRDVQTMPATGDLDSDARAFGIDYTCSACQATGHIPCRDGKCTGSVPCSECKGTTKITCNFCKGEKKLQCNKCGASGKVRYTCPMCQGSGRYKCHVCGGNRPICSECGGRASKTVSGYRDIGKGPVFETISVPCSCRGGYMSHPGRSHRL